MSEWNTLNKDAPLSDEQKELFEKLHTDLFRMFQNSRAWEDNGVTFRYRIDDFVCTYINAMDSPFLAERDALAERVRKLDKLLRRAVDKLNRQDMYEELQAEIWQVLDVEGSP